MSGIVVSCCSAEGQGRNPEARSPSSQSWGPQKFILGSLPEDRYGSDTAAGHSLREAVAEHV